MSKKRNILFILLFGGALLATVYIVMFYVFFSLYMDRDVPFGDVVAVVDIKGEIVYDMGKIAELEGYRDDESVKAVLLHIVSPGGGVTASQELHDTVAKLRETKPVVACMGPVAASGGYYVAAAADSIVAQAGTLTGSIGVIAMFLNTKELYHKIGLDVTVIKAGEYKDVGSPHREMTTAEKAYLGALLDTVYNQFLEAVSRGRDMPLERVRELAEGRLYSGEEARSVGLVDRLGTYEDALALAAEMGGIEGEPRTIKRRIRPSWFERFFGRKAPTLPVVDEERVSLKYIIP